MNYLLEIEFLVVLAFSFPVFSQNGENHSSEILINEEENSVIPEKPNVIIFLADDLGYGDLGLTGHPTTRTTNIDALAQSGKFLTNFYCTIPLCSPSRASIMTGRYPVRSGVYPRVFFPTSIHGLPRNETTIADVLKQSGYKTEIIGKWHLGVGRDREFLPGEGSYGFDNFFGLPYSHDLCPCPTCFPHNGSCWAGSTCYEQYVSCPLFRNKVIEEQPVYLPTLSQRFLGKAKEFIIESEVEGSPFFLFMSFLQVHLPHFNPSTFIGKSVRGEIGDALLEMDWMVGEIVNLLKELKMENNTLIWFTSDNGPSLRHHEYGGSAGLLRCGKGTTWDGGVRVPSIIHWPGKIRPGKSDALVSTLDMFPTLSAIVGYSYENLTLDGIDASNLLLNDAEESPRKFLAIYSASPAEDKGPYAVIYNQFKAHFFTKGHTLSDNENIDWMCPVTRKETPHDPPLLFDLYKDPGEKYDLGSKLEYSEIQKAISEWRENQMLEMQWMESLTLTQPEEGESVEPCCTNTKCAPYPQCCDCPSESTAFVRDFPSFDANETDAL